MAEPCELIRDLIPLVKGRNASAESVRRVETHLADCDACAEYYEACTPNRQRRSRGLLFFLFKLLVAGALVFFGAAIPRSFWQCISLIASGVFTYFAFRRGRWILFLAVPVAVLARYFIYYWQSGGQFYLNDFLRDLSYNYILFLFFPLIFVLTGMAVAFLCRFALRPRQKGDSLPRLLKWTVFIDRSSPDLRIFAGAAALAIVVAGAVWVNSNYGNPVSSLIAERAMRDYLRERYSSYNLTYNGTEYSRVGAYTGGVSSPTDPDVSFSLTYYSDGRVIDDFMSKVASGSNKLYRLQRELNLRLLPILKDKYGSSVYSVFTSPNNNSSQMMLDKAVGGMTSLSAGDAPDLSIRISLELSPMTPETAAAKITECYNILKAKGYVFGQYSLDVHEISTSQRGSVYGVTLEDIESGNLVTRLNAAMLDQTNSTVIKYFRAS